MRGFGGSIEENVLSRRLGRLERLGNAWIFRVGRDVGQRMRGFGGPIEENISSRRRGRPGRLGNAWIPESTLEALASRARR